jgi:L-2-hydroxyglutarate oxidase LhgO
MDFDAIIVGAGIVGLAIAREFARAGWAVLVVEQDGAPGRQTSSRNSGVIHAGIYYQPGSLKAQLCRRGRDLLYAYCASHGIAHQRCGKLIVAVDDGEIAKLEAIAARARANNVTNLEWLSAADVAVVEPDLRCVRALHSPSTGIVDVAGLIMALRGDVEAARGACVVNTPALAARQISGGWVLACGGAAPVQITTRWLINAAGLSAQNFAAHIEGLAQQHIPPLHRAKGNYFTLSGARAPFQRLIYPAPVAGGLGVHVTRDLGGGVRFGPDVEWLDPAVAADYRVDPARAPGFAAAIQRYWPALPAAALVPDYAGIRPKLVGPGEADGDFRIDGPNTHGLAGLIALYGIESPGVTAALALATHVRAMAG